jgi:mono/diheme cytochrome c family protein
MKRTLDKTDTVNNLPVVLVVAGIAAAAALGAAAATAGDTSSEISPGLVMPKMDPVHGKALFGSKGCVVCHAVNGVGGPDAPPIDASTMKPEMSPFDFVARMWNHSQGMIAMQQDEMGDQITFENGQQIADIIAFLHDADVQKTFSEDDIPADIKAHMEEGDDNSSGMMTNGKAGNGSMMGSGKVMGK